MKKLLPLLLILLFAVEAGATGRWYAGTAGSYDEVDKTKDTGSTMADKVKYNFDFVEDLGGFWYHLNTATANRQDTSLWSGSYTAGFDEDEVTNCFLYFTDFTYPVHQLLYLMGGYDGQVKITTGATGAEPASPNDGELFGDTTRTMLEWYDGSSWQDVSAGGVAGVSSIKAQDSATGLTGNVVIRAGTAITVTSSSNTPKVITISNTGITSLDVEDGTARTGAMTLEVGSGISLASDSDQITVTNDRKFTVMDWGQDIAEDLTFCEGTGISMTMNTSTSQVTVSGAYTAGSGISILNGTISVGTTVATVGNTVDIPQNTIVLDSTYPPDVDYFDWGRGELETILFDPDSNEMAHSDFIVPSNVDLSYDVYLELYLANTTGSAGTTCFRLDYGAITAASMTTTIGATNNITPTEYAVTVTRYIAASNSNRAYVLPLTLTGSNLDNGEEIYYSIRRQSYSGSDDSYTGDVRLLRRRMKATDKNPS